MKKYISWICLLISIISLFAISIPKVQGFLPLQIERIVGKKAPEFTVKDLSGTNVSLSSFIGKPILLNIWATWCPCCRRERAYLESLHREYKDRGLVILAVSIDTSVKRVKRYLKRIPASYTVLIDEDGINGIVARSYRVYGLPTSFLINRDGIIRYKFTGLRRWTDPGLKKFIEELLKE